MIRAVHISLFILAINCVISQSRASITSKMLYSPDDAQSKQVIHRHLSSMYKDNPIDQDIVDDFLHLIRENSDVFQYLAETTTDPEFLPYLDRYFDLKEELKGPSTDTDITVIFSHNPLKSTDHDKFILYSGMCDNLTNFVFIDRGFWNYHSDNEKIREAIISHEAGHCDLDRIHYWNDTDFSFMDNDTLELLLLPNPPNYTDIWHFLNRPYDTILKAKSDIDEAFNFMYQELFSIENTTRLCISRTNLCIRQEDYFQQFKNTLLPRLRYVTNFTVEDTFERYVQ